MDGSNSTARLGKVIVFLFLIIVTLTYTIEILCCRQDDWYRPYWRLVDRLGFPRLYCPLACHHLHPLERWKTGKYLHFARESRLDRPWHLVRQQTNCNNILCIKYILSKGQIRREDKDLSFATGRGSLTRNKSILCDRSCSKFGQTFTEMTRTTRCGNTSGKSTEPALHSILNLRQKNFISTKEFNGLVDTLQLLNVIVVTKDLIDRSKISTWQRFCTSTWLSPQCRQSTMSLRF